MLAWDPGSGGALAALELACSGESVNESIYMVVNVMDVRRRDAVITVRAFSSWASGEFAVRAHPWRSNLE